MVKGMSFRYHACYHTNTKWSKELGRMLRACVSVCKCRASVSIRTCKDLSDPVEEARAVVQFARHTDTQSDCRVEVGATNGT